MSQNHPTLSTSRKQLPVALVTNDDGLESCFLEALVSALREDFTVYVAAPASEQSWISRAVSRHRPVVVEEASCAGAPAWRIDGTPTDCVNLALGHLLPAPPAVVVSGINIGFNTTLPLVLSSGTVAGALEGSIWGLHAVATSMVVPRELFAGLLDNRRKVPPSLQSSLQHAAHQTARFSADLIQTPPERLVVHNLNFPNPTTENTALRQTNLADALLGSLFQRLEDQPISTYAFAYTPGTPLPTQNHLTDRVCLDKGEASHSRIDYKRLGHSG
jgi:5'-nucleotidase